MRNILTARAWLSSPPKVILLRRSTRLLGELEYLSSYVRMLRKKIEDEPGHDRPFRLPLQPVHACLSAVIANCRATASSPVPAAGARRSCSGWGGARTGAERAWRWPARRRSDRKSTRLNSSHLGISYAVFCLK